MKKIFWAGDSTVMTNHITTYPQTGIGQVLYLYLNKEVQVINHAINGRSTKSFMDEGRLQTIDKQIGKDDILFIQFGHNDEKIADPARYTDPKGSFQDNLKTFIRVARKNGAFPVLITPLERRCFEEEHKLGTGEHRPYVEAMKWVAENEKVPMIDLNKKSRDIMEEKGQTITEYWFMNLTPGKFHNYREGKTDNTHLQYEGAVRFAGLIAEGLEELGGWYTELLWQPTMDV